jgi:hypothetical protein
MTRTMLALASVLALAGCGGGGLEAAGNFDVTTSAATTGFNFPQPTRLDGGAGLITGSCIMTRAADGGYGVVVDLYSSDENPDGRAIRSMTIMTRSDQSTGTIQAQLGQDDFENTGCLMHVNAIDPSTGQVVMSSTSDCVITGPAGETASVEFDLRFNRCGVQ